MMMNKRSDQVGDDMKARMLIVNSEPKLDFCSSTVDRLEPVIAETVINMQSTKEST